jgi:hypothetical protein
VLSLLTLDRKAAIHTGMRILSGVVQDGMKNHMKTVG